MNVGHLGKKVAVRYMCESKQFCCVILDTSLPIVFNCIYLYWRRECFVVVLDLALVLILAGMAEWLSIT